LYLIFTGKSLAAITQDLDTAKNDIAYDYGLISGWASQELSEGLAYSAVGGANRPADVHGIGSFEIGLGINGDVWNVDTGKLRALPTRTIKTASIDYKGTVGVPGILVQGKIGLPWDIDLGLKYGGFSFKLDEGKSSVNANNTVYGFEFRRQFFGKGITGVAIPAVALSLTYDIASGKIDSSQAYTETTSETYSGISYTQAVDSTTKGEIKWSTQSLGAKAIVSKNFLFITPYLGIGLNKNYGSVDTSITTSGTLSLTGGGSSQSQSISITGSGSDSAGDSYVRYIGGFDINILALKLNLNGELADKYYAVGLWAHLSF
jgi:hypothetical protein